MANGGYRKKINLDIRPQEFVKLSLRQQNEYIIRLAKRYNQRIKDLVKRNPYDAMKLYEFHKADFGTTIFSRRKARTKEEAEMRFKELQGFASSRYGSAKQLKAFKQKAIKQLAENVGLSNLDDESKKELAGFFDYIYSELKIDKSEYNYKELTDFYSLYKLSESERTERVENIKELWRRFKETDKTLAEWTVEQKMAMKEAGIINKNEKRSFSQIIRDSYKE